MTSSATPSYSSKYLLRFGLSVAITVFATGCGGSVSKNSAYFSGQAWKLPSPAKLLPTIACQAVGEGTDQVNHLILGFTLPALAKRLGTTSELTIRPDRGDDNLCVDLYRVASDGSFELEPSHRKNRLPV
jgi:hypothetical protein